jgi:hypothetical protein
MKTTEKEFMIKKANRWKSLWSWFGLLLILLAPTLLIYSIITEDWNWKYWAVWGVLMLFQRFFNAAIKHAIKLIEKEAKP